MYAPINYLNPAPNRRRLFACVLAAVPLDVKTSLLFIFYSYFWNFKKVLKYPTRDSPSFPNFVFYHILMGPRVAQWLRHCANSGTVSGSIPGGVTLGIFP
jgi:hypothetical protein